MARNIQRKSYNKKPVQDATDMSSDNSSNSKIN